MTDVVVATEMAAEVETMADGDVAMGPGDHEIPREAGHRLLLMTVTAISTVQTTLKDPGTMTIIATHRGDPVQVEAEDKNNQYKV